MTNPHMFSSMSCINHLTLTFRFSSWCSVPSTRSISIPRSSSMCSRLLLEAAECQAGAESLAALEHRRNLSGLNGISQPTSLLHMALRSSFASSSSSTWAFKRRWSAARDSGRKQADAVRRWKNKAFVGVESLLDWTCRTTRSGQQEQMAALKGSLKAL